MPFDNSRRFKLLALSAIAAACACAAPATRAQVPSAPQAPAMAPTVAPTAPQAPNRNGPGIDAGKAKAPAAAASGAAPDGLTLKQLEKIEREMAISKAKKALRDQTRADKPDDAGLPTGIPGAAGGLGAPRMIVMPDGRRVFQAPGGPFGASGPGAYGLAGTPEQQLSEFKVLSVVSFRGSTSADIIDGSSLVKTIKVGDRVGPGTVASITSDGSVSVGVPSSAMAASTTLVAMKRDTKRAVPRGQNGLGPGKYAQQGMIGAGGSMMRYVTLARATDRVSGNAPSQYGGTQQPPRLDISQPINNGFMADATSVPMVGASRPNGLGAPQFGPQGAPSAMGAGTFAVPVSPPGAFPPPAN